MKSKSKFDAKKFIELTDEFRTPMHLWVDGRRYGYGYEAEPRFEEVFTALARSQGFFESKENRDAVCNGLMWMGRVRNMREGGIPRGPHYGFYSYE